MLNLVVLGPRPTRHAYTVLIENSAMPNRKIDDLLERDHHRFSPLQKLLDQAADLDAATLELRALLPASLTKACRVADLKPPVLTIGCRDASSATKLRFLKEELLTELSTLPQYAHFTEIRVRVAQG